MTKDDVGDRGQLLLGLLLTDLCGRDVPYFRPRFLGDKSVLKNLRDEVIAFWNSRDMVLKDSRFRE